MTVLADFRSCFFFFLFFFEMSVQGKTSNLKAQIHLKVSMRECFSYMVMSHKCPNAVLPDITCGTMVREGKVEHELCLNVTHCGYRPTITDVTHVESSFKICTGKFYFIFGDPVADASY